MNKKIKKLLIALGLVIVLALAGPPAVFLGWVWCHDKSVPLASTVIGVDDASRLNRDQPAEVIAIASNPTDAERQLSDLFRRAVEQGSNIAISGARHSMGGHTLYPGAIVLDMLPFNHISLDEKRRILTVGAGARWSEIIPYLDHRGFAVAIMQSNNDFTVGGSLSVNCHGWQNDSPPISSTVESFRIVTASGTILRCSRTENQELFSLALGGYGLFGVILEAKLRVVPNEFYIAEAHRVSPADYTRAYSDLTKRRSDVGMAYGRISVAPNSFLTEGVITLLRRHATERVPIDTLKDEKPSRLKRIVFRGGVESSYGKNLRWWLEKIVGETGGNVLSRNDVMNEPAALYANRDPGSTDILHEYFIPSARLGEFIDKAKPVFSKHRPELLNITVRNVEADRDTFLRYAHEEVFGLVMLFHQRRDAASETAMQGLTRELIDTALSCGGRFFLPYRLHATQEQFLAAYPQAREFFALKQRYDPAGIFENKFFLQYDRRSSDKGTAQPAEQKAL
jgi:FAD/FMN-containing dehydrogenase